MSLRPEARARLRARFLEGLHDRLDLMTAVRARMDTGDDAAWADGRRLGHQLAGTGASFGFAALTERGRELELAPHDQLRPALDRLIESVRAVLHDAALPAAADERP
jgi:HPt (histidine-containing phosphotransfer) domain-containing protein